MTEYQWNDGRIARVVVEHGRKYPNAFIVASAHCSAEDYASLPRQLNAMGLQTFADTYQGAPALRVGGFETDAGLMNDLQRTNMLSHAPDNIIPDAPSEQKPTGVNGLKQWVKDNSMVAAGISYLVADGLAFASGYVRGDKNGMQQGAVWSLTSVVLALFGTRDPQQQMQAMYGKMDEYFRQQGYEIGTEDLRALEKLRGNSDDFYHKMVDFIYQHPVEINNTLQGWGGLQLTLAGLNQKQLNLENPLLVSSRPNYFKVLAGLCVAGGMWGGLLIPEDPDAGMSEAEKEQRFLDRQAGKEVPAAKPVSLLEHPVDWVKQRPLRLSGWGAMINNMLVGSGALFFERPNLHNYMKPGGVKDQFSDKLAARETALGSMPDGTARMEAFASLREDKEAFADLNIKQKNRVLGSHFDLATPLPNMLANWLYGMSPKDRRGFLKEDGYLEELYTMASNVFKDMPVEQRNERIQKFAGFMATQPDMKSNAAEIEQAVHSKIETLEKNPWNTAAVKAPVPVASQITHVDTVSVVPTQSAQLH